jgi:hypothetical protein
MIITSNSVQHEYTIPSVTIVGDVDGFENVAERVEIYLHSSTTFDHTYETTIYDMESPVGIATTVTESKTVTEFTHYGVDLNTAGISTASFSAWDDLEEDQVLQWTFDADSENTSRIQNEQEAKVLEAKDKILNPRKYQRDTPVTPWRKRADEESSNNL